jgi:hypothetical protein
MSSATLPDVEIVPTPVVGTASGSVSAEEDGIEGRKATEINQSGYYAGTVLAPVSCATNDCPVSDRQTGTEVVPCWP